MNQTIEYMTWDDGRSVSFPTMTAAIRYAQIHQVHQLRGWRADPVTESCYYCPLVREGDIWRWLDEGAKRELSQHADSSDDPIVLTVVDTLEQDRGHGDHQITTRYRPDEWPPAIAADLDPTGRWSRVGFLPPEFIGDPKLANFALHYQPETIASVMSALSTDLEETAAMTDTLLWRHLLAVEHSELSFDDRERQIDDVILDWGGQVREYLVGMLVAS